MAHRFRMVLLGVASGLCVELCGLLAPGVAGADTIVLIAAKDATLFTGAATIANGSGPAMFSGRTRRFGARRALLAFDLPDSIPTTSRIDSVSLTLRASNTAGGPQPDHLHRLLSDWGEGPSSSFGGGGDFARPGDVTWIHTFFDSQLWGTPGGDFVPGASAEIPVNAPGTYTWGSTAGLVADVQAWLGDRTTNFGWILIGNEASGGTAKRFDSRENPDPTSRPRLTIHFTPLTAIETATWARVKALYRAYA